MDLIQQLEQEEIARLGNNIPDFAPGDTVVVNVNVVEGTRKRAQAYEGVVISRRNRGLNSNFIVRKISSGEGVERTFQLYSPLIASIEVKRRGDVRRAKLYYLRERSGNRHVSRKNCRPAKLPPSCCEVIASVVRKRHPIGCLFSLETTFGKTAHRSQAPARRRRSPASPPCRPSAWRSRGCARASPIRRCGNRNCPTTCACAFRDLRRAAVLMPHRAAPGRPHGVADPAYGTSDRPRGPGQFSRWPSGRGRLLGDRDGPARDGGRNRPDASPRRGYRCAARPRHRVRLCVTPVVGLVTPPFDLAADSDRSGRNFRSALAVPDGWHEPPAHVASSCPRRRAAALSMRCLTNVSSSGARLPACCAICFISYAPDGHVENRCRSRRLFAVP